MNKRCYKFHAAAKVALSTLIFVTVIGCSSVEHIRELREAQQTFNDISDRQNKDVFTDLVRSPDSAKNASKDNLSTVVHVELNEKAGGYYDLYVAYRDNALKVAALNKRAGRQLKQDSLYGVSKTIEMMAMWKASYYRLLTEAYRTPQAATEGKNNTLAHITLPASMLDVKNLIGSTRDDLKNEVVYPKERLLLAAAEPLLYYDFAFLTTIKAYQEGKLKPLDDLSDPDEEQLRTIKPLVLSIVEQMAKAERELQNIGKNDETVKEIAQQPQFRNFLALTRFLMLRSATVLIVDQKINMTCGNQFKGLNFQWTEIDATEETPVLTERVKQFYAEAFSDAGGDGLQVLMKKMNLSQDDCRKSYIFQYWRPGDQAGCR